MLNNTLYLWLYELVFNVYIYIYIMHVYLHFLYFKYRYSILKCLQVYCRYICVYNVYVHDDFAHRHMPRFMHLTLNDGVLKWGAAKLITFGIDLVVGRSILRIEQFWSIAVSLFILSDRETSSIH